MTNRQIAGFLTKIYRKLEDDDFVIRFIRSKKFSGACHRLENIIDLNPHLDVLSTFIHEMIHHIYPKLEEQEVLSREKFIMNRLSHAQLANIFFHLGKALVRSYK